MTADHTLYLTNFNSFTEIQIVQNKYLNKKNFHDPHFEGNKKMSLEKAGGHADLIWLCQSC